MAALRLGHFVYAVPGPVTAGFLAGCGFILLDESFALMGVGSFRRAARGILSKIGLLAPDMTAASELEAGTQAGIVLAVGLVLALVLTVTWVVAPRRFSVVMPSLLIGTAVLVHIGLAIAGRSVSLVPGGPAKPGQQPWAVGAGWILATPDRVETRDVPGSGVFESLRGAWAWATGDVGRLSMSALLRELPQALVVVPLVTVVTVLLRAVGLDVWEGQQQRQREEEEKEENAQAEAAKERTELAARSDQESSAAAAPGASADADADAPGRAADTGVAAAASAVDGEAGAAEGVHPDGAAAGEGSPLLTTAPPDAEASGVDDEADQGEDCCDSCCPRPTSGTKGGRSGADRAKGLTRFDAELQAAGLSCLASSLVGGPPAFVEYATTVLNTAAGARSRAASIVTGLVCLLLAITGMAPLMLRAVPVPVLGGVIAYLGMHLVWEWGWRYALSAGGGATGDVFVVVITLAGTAIVGFLPGLVAGAGLTLLQHCLCSAERAAIRDSYPLGSGTSGADVVVLVGQLDFGAAAALVWRVQERLERVERRIGDSAAALCMPGRWEGPMGGRGAQAGADDGEGSVAGASDDSTPGTAKQSSGGGIRTMCRWPWPAGNGASEEGGGPAEMPELEWLVLDMSGVTGMDRSAAAAVLKLCDVMRSEAHASPPAGEEPAGGSPSPPQALDGDGDGSADPESEMRHRSHALPGGASAAAAAGVAAAAAPGVGAGAGGRKLPDAGRTRVIVVGLSPGLRDFVEGSSGHGGDGDMVRTGGADDDDDEHLRSARLQGALPLFRRTVKDATQVVLADQTARRPTA